MNTFPVSTSRGTSAAATRLVGSLALLIVFAAPVCAQVHEAATVDAASQVLLEVMKIPAWQIPASLLSDAKGIAILPNLVKGSFVVGVRHGHGVVVVRDEAGRWKPPVFVSLTGGSVGWQIGLQATDIILVFKTHKSVKGLLAGKFTLGADVAVAAGPVGREAAAATDAALRAEIYSYSRSRGLFVGVSLDGSALQINSAANAAYYGGPTASPATAPPGQPIPLPPSAARLLDVVAHYTAPPRVPAPVPVTSPQGQALQLRQQLADASIRLAALVDNQWKNYLALPAEVYAAGGAVNVQSLGQSLGRFDAVARDPRYQVLSQRSEFRSTHELLRRYLSLEASRGGPALALPPPP
jgi:lipid-binding SYLF domain-containing protein